MEIHGSLTNFCTAFGCREVNTIAPLPESPNYYYFYFFLVLLLVVAGFLLGFGFWCSAYLITWIVWRWHYAHRPISTPITPRTHTLVIEEQGDDDC